MTDPELTGTVDVGPPTTPEDAVAGTAQRPDRPPSTWPAAALVIAFLAFVAFVGWLCEGVITTWLTR